VVAKDRMAKLHLILLQNTPVFEQLAIEEALLRADERNFCLINAGSPPAIVMGISGKAEEHIDHEKIQTKPIPIIRRFSGGGTVVVDENTLFVTFIFERKDIDLGNCPKKIMEWSEAIYKPVFHPQNFQLKENDYVLSDKKVGGNAQYFSKNRWLHHTTFLWDYDKDLMKLLQIPPKMPEYRQKRAHTDFLDTLRNYYPSKDSIKEKLLQELSKQFLIETLPLSEIEGICLKPHRKATTYIYL
jgi:lipoate---protein ligase